MGFVSDRTDYDYWFFTLFHLIFAKPVTFEHIMGGYLERSGARVGVVPGSLDIEDLTFVYAF